MQVINQERTSDDELRIPCVKFNGKSQVMQRLGGGIFKCTQTQAPDMIYMSEDAHTISEQ